ncbi:hypothetical protein FRC08_009834 [Ceratobasidium sp. 394]|nr:hypothetical protein FRC08_009834 [Ceratobasidium sp. 394]
MPAKRRQRKSRASAVTLEPTSESETMGSKTIPIVQSDAPDSSKELVVIVLDSDSSSTPASIHDSEVVVSGKSSDVQEPSEPESSKSRLGGGVIDSNHGESFESLDVNRHALEEASPSIRSNIKLDTLTEAIQTTRYKATIHAANESPLVPFLTPSGHTGIPIIDHAMDNLRASRYALWIGDANKIFQNCKWITSQRSNMSTLQWKSDAPDKPIGTDGEAMIGLLGMVSTDGSAMNPDAGWQFCWGEDKLHKQKRSFYVVYPGVMSNIPLSWWERQIEGGGLIVDNARRLSSGGTGNFSYCCVDRDMGAFRIRSPLFLPHLIAGDCEDGDCSFPEPEANMPPSHRYSTWVVGSQEIWDVLDRVVARGYEPQVLEAYDRFNKLIHPNKVSAVLSGAIVLVYCTLERALFGKKQGEPPQWQFYANLAKVQVLRYSSPMKSIMSKCRFAHGYGLDDPSGSNGSSATGEPVSRKSVRIAVPVN